MSKIISRREILVDRIFVILQTFCSTLFLLLGIVGLYYRGIIGALAGVIVGYFTGRLARWCMGIRGKDPNIGFFIRMRERANGKNRCLLEYLIEKARGNEFTIQKCKKITDAYDSALSQMQMTSNPNERSKILHELDHTIKEISYAKEKN